MRQEKRLSERQAQFRVAAIQRRLLRLRVAAEPDVEDAPGQRVAVGV